MVGLVVKNKRTEGKLAATIANWSVSMLERQDLGVLACHAGLYGGVLTESYFKRGIESQPNRVHKVITRVSLDQA